jgi:thioesterase domain-containing protein
LQPNQPVHVFRLPEEAMQDDQVANAMFKELAAQYLEEMQKTQPAGPYFFGGFCYGGDVAYEMARQLLSKGQEPGAVALIYTCGPRFIQFGIRQKLKHHGKILFELKAPEKLEYMKTLAKNRMRKISAGFADRMSVYASQSHSIYAPLHYSGEITLFHPIENADRDQRGSQLGWQGLAEKIQVYDVPGDKYSIFKEPHVRVLAEQLRLYLDQAETEATEHHKNRA